MCGAFAIINPFKAGWDMPFNAGYNSPVFEPRYNARPGQRVPVVLNTQPDRMQMVLWSLTPNWLKGKLLFNTRKDTLEDKWVFKDSLKNRRCIIPADAFYEWGVINGHKVPYLFRLKTRTMFFFAGIWQVDDKAAEPAFTIITTEPNKTVEKIHNRMPAILPPHKEKDWLNTKTDPELALDLINPYPDNLMEYYPISTAVNSSKNDFPEILKPV